jgi:sugar transferase (PEP-CTERM/EpsH1 system associated)
MRILVLTAKLPYPLTGGAEIRNFNLLRETAKRHETFLLSLLHHPSDREHFPELLKHCKKVVGLDLRRPLLRKLCNAVGGLLGEKPFILREYHRAEMADALRQFVAQEKIDAIHGHFLHVGQYAMHKRNAAFVYDPHNLEHKLWERFETIQRNPLTKFYARTQIPKFIEWQRIVARHSEKIVTLSDADRDEYRRIAPDADVSTVPNGADVEFFEPRDVPVEPNSMIYFGNFGWAPQDDAAVYFHDEILPLVRQQIPDAKLYFVGKTPSEPIRRLASEKVIVTGFVPDIREYVARAAVVVIPLRVGAGTKHRIYQSLAMKKAVVTTTVGAEGMALKHGENAMIADTPPSFADCVLQLLRDAGLRERLGENGRRLVLEHHDWRAIYQKLDDAFHQAVEKRRAAASGRALVSTP